MTRSTFVRRLARDPAGVVLVEFALLLLLLLLLVFGIIDVGRALYTANSVNAAAREGARWAAVLPNPVAAEPAIKDTVVAHIRPLGGRLARPGDVTVTYNYSSGTPATLHSMTVAVAYPFELLTPFGALLGRGDTITVRGAAQFRWELAP